MEYEKQIEIKLEGNNCTINFPKEKNISRQNSSLTNIDDISFSVSVTSEDETLSKKNEMNNSAKDNNNNKSNTKQCLYSNEKSKLEITYLSIFNSELKSESSNIKTPLLLLNYKSNFDKIKEQQKKDSVVKKLNFEKIENKENKENINSEIPNINIRKLPLIKKSNVIKKISKNLNKEYFIHEKIYSSNKNMQRIILDKKLKENIIKNSKGDFPNKNRTQIIDNNNILNNESFNTNNKYQITENYTTKGNLNFLSNKQNSNSNNVILNKCPSKPNLSYMRLKLNNILKINSKEKEKEKPKNNSLKELDIMPKIINNENIHNIRTKRLSKNQIICPSLTSGNNNVNLNTINSFNKSANNNNKMKAFNINENSNIKTPLILNKQILLKTPKTNSYSCSTSYSAKNNKMQNDINMSSDIKKSLKEKDPILIKIEAHNSLLKNFMMNKNKENVSNNIKNDFFLNQFNNNTNEIKFGEESLNINNNKEIRLQKFNTDFKLTINKNKKIGLLTERNMKNNNNEINSLNKRKINDWQNVFKNKEYVFDFKNKIL
jgi:hypothetical protein